jgi:lysozyme
MPDTYDAAALRDELTRDEGRRSRPYYDQGMRTTIGIGRNLSDVGLSDDEILYLLANDVARCEHDLDHNLPWWRTLDPVRQRVLLNMDFNLGWNSFGMFARFFSAVHQHRWDDAALEMLASRWHTQVGDRALRLEAMMRTGKAAP